MFTIKSGPFAGHTVPAEEIRWLSSDTPGGEPLANWPAHHRAARLVSHPAFAGYRLAAEVSFTDAKMPRRDQDGRLSTDQYPTILAVAKAYPPDGVPWSASSLDVFDGPKAWERTENNAFSRLLEMMGLPAYFRASDQLGDSPRRDGRVEVEAPQGYATSVPIAALPEAFDPDAAPATDFAPFPVDDPVVEASAPFEQPETAGDAAEVTAEATPAPAIEATPTDTPPDAPETAPVESATAKAEAEAADAAEATSGTGSTATDEAAAPTPAKPTTPDRRTRRAKASGDAPSEVQMQVMRRLAAAMGRPMPPPEALLTRASFARELTALQSGGAA